MVKKADVAEQYKIILASASPRRKELLAGLGLDFEVRLIDNIDESFSPTLRGEAIPLAIAHKKAEAYRTSINKGELLITADTIVCLDGQILGKPTDREDAISMLKQLSGREHQVITAVTMNTTAKQRSFAVETSVSFAELSEDEIVFYVDNYTPYDKAGSYGIQEWIGYVGVESIRGSYFNVMGLPIQRLYKELREF